MVRSRFRFAMGSLLAGVAFFAAGRGLAFCDPLGDIKNAALSTANARSYHFTLTSPAIGNAQGDFLLPGTLHETMPHGMEMIVLPSASYMKMNGKWMKYPGGGSAMFGGMNAASVLAKMNAHTYHVTDLGMRNFGGSTMHAYAVETTTATGKPSKSVDYVDASGRLAGMTIDTMVMHFSNFGEPVHVAAPL